MVPNHINATSWTFEAFEPLLNAREETVHWARRHIPAPRAQRVAQPEELGAFIASQRSLFLTQAAMPLPYSTRTTFARHKLHFIIAFVISVIILLFVVSPAQTYQRFTRPQNQHPEVYAETLSQPKVPPPKYESLRKWEANLPQHNLELPTPEGKNGRYVKFSNQIVMLGWNNVLNEVGATCMELKDYHLRLMNAHLAYMSKRAYVFKDYVWKPEYYPWPKNQRYENPPRTPLGALIGGSVVGQPFDEGDDAPRSISEKWFDIVCPWKERRFIYTGDVKPRVAHKNGDETFDHWAKLLRDAPERCIEVQSSGDDNFPQTFDLWLWGSDRILSLWDSFSKSPTSRLLTTSPIVGAAVKRNEYLFTPRGPRPTHPVSPDPYERMLAMHIRRGDFKGACLHLATWNSTFYSWNLLPNLPDRLLFPANIVWNTTEYHDAHLERCLPDFDAIIRKARNSRDDYVNASTGGRRRTLDIMYLLTNEKGEWIEKLKAALSKDGWNTIVTTNDLELDSEGIDTGMAIDMDIARKAAVFVGNGRSTDSFTGITMLSLQLLPAALLAVVYASPVLATASSSNDPFRAIAAQAPRKPNLPVCCLKREEPLERLEEEVLLSFEEWKQKQSLLQEKERAREREAINRSTHVAGDTVNGSDTIFLSPQNTTGNADSVDLDEQAKAPKTEPLPPHFRVPLTDRFNYASLECSARVHLSHRSAKSASSILSSKRDRYMLSPCNPANKERQFVVVELCEDIRIDTVQLANYEFFSGIFKEFRISVAKTDITGEKGWTDAGHFRAKNVRGVQSFHPPTSLRDFYRYIRIDFLSHYGSEYYCPVSLLRVYGLTHLEEWKWDMWEQESRAKLSSADGIQSPSSINDVADPPAPKHVPDTVGESKAAGASTNLSDIVTTEKPATVPSADLNAAHIVIPLSSGSVHTFASQTMQSMEQGTPSVTPAVKPPVPSPSTSATNDLHDSLRPISVSMISVMLPSATTRPSTIQPSPVTVASQSESAANDLNSSRSAVTTPLQNTISANAPATTITTPTSSSIVIAIPVVSPPAFPVTTGGESIYRTIMNRLTALEANHTLYTRYTEQQTNNMYKMLRRVGEDVGRLEGIGKAQSQMYQRSLRDWEKRHLQMQLDYGELMARLEYLSDEIVLEKRLGIAQLCLLLAVLVFMGLTRGSRGDEQPRLNNSVRGWGKSLSGEWKTRFGRRGRSETRDRDHDRDREVQKVHPHITQPAPVTSVDKITKIEFPRAEHVRARTENSEQTPLEPKNINTPQTHAHTHKSSFYTSMAARSISSDARVHPGRKSRSQTPSMRNATRPHPSGTPTSVTFSATKLERSNSHGLVVAHHGVSMPLTTHKSARKWARTAHLHEVRTVDRTAARRRRGREDENAVVVNGSASETEGFWARRETGKDMENGSVVRVNDLGSPRKERGGGRFRSTKPFEDGEGDPWVDTDLDEGEWEARLDTGKAMSFSAGGNEH
ncbi:hypothetical protein H0H81_008912 [Sphagnurus paluster]|uniref:SUN domain-containing protein n=1 Tax=Sphagnurus paluster TaxID=117069 RepID=A0A9P7FWN0_9AGAR|nr:hypothetical protein H0H81_008912 [Sphagnurus paluster]